MRTIPRTTELEASQLRALIRESSNLEVEMIREEPASGSVHISFDEDRAMAPLDSGDPLPAGARTKLDRDAFEPIDDGDPIPAGSRTRIDRDALEPLPRPPEYPPLPERRVWPAVLIVLTLVATTAGYWLVA